MTAPDDTSGRPAGAAVPIEPAVATEGVWFSYDGAPIIEDASFGIARGDLVSVVGPNGGGKTTLLKLLLGLVTPDRGRVRVLGGPPEAARPRIGYMPQAVNVDPRFPATAMDVVLMGRLGRRAAGPYSRHDREAAREALALMDAEALRRRPFADLSGGQRQRVLIARALAARPEMLLLDEPTANLDPAAENELYELLRGLEDRLTILLVSHDLGFVSQFVHTVVCVNRHVHVHPVEEVSGAMIREVYGSDVMMVRHDQLHRPPEDQP